MASLFHSTRNKLSGHRKTASTDSDKSEGKPRDKASYSLFPSHERQGQTLPVAQAIPAWHVHGSPAPNDSTRAGRTSIDSASPADTSQSVNNGPPVLSAVAVAQNVPSRSSSLRSKGQHEPRHRRKSDQRPELDRIDSESAQLETSDAMTYSSESTRNYLNRKPLPIPKDEDELGDRVQQLSLQQQQQKTAGQEHADRQHNGTNFSRKPEVGDYRSNNNHQGGGEVQTKVVGNEIEHLKLPDGFQMQDSSHTVVDTVVRPAVTREVVHRNIQEIQQQVITRDIHVHHYYNYVQPIKVVEILPAKHYILDGVTGMKKEIPPPPGWQLPLSLQPSVPDLSGIKISSRHYLINDEHPNGIIEPAPAGFHDRISPGVPG